jgi:hypothetical protein
MRRGSVVCDVAFVVFNAVYATRVPASTPEHVAPMN